MLKRWTVSALMGMLLLVIGVMAPVGGVQEAQATEFYLSVPFPGDSNDGRVDVIEGDGPLSVRIANTYLSPLILVLMSITTAACVLYIILGGYEIMVSGSITGNEAGKEKILKAMLGIVIIFLSALILNIINPSVFTL